MLLSLFLYVGAPCSSTTSTDSTEPTPALLLISCNSCNLLLPIKQYGEVHVEIRGSSQVRTGKFTQVYGEVHMPRTGKFTSLLAFQQPTSQKRTGKFTQYAHQIPPAIVRGSSPCTRPYANTIVRAVHRSEPKARCTGKFTWRNLPAVRGSSLAEAPHTSFRGVIEQEGLSRLINPDAGIGCLHTHTRP